MIVAFRETQARMPPVYGGPIPSLARWVGMACVPASVKRPKDPGDIGVLLRVVRVRSPRRRPNRDDAFTMLAAWGGWTGCHLAS